MRLPRVVVGMSGGVDSAVSAWLLKQRGYDVAGVYMNNWDSVEEGTSRCPRSKDEADARRICDRLSIPFHTVDFIKQYWTEVFQRMLDDYRRGRTLVPDVLCNRHIKFAHLHTHAVTRLGADLIATGHYCRTSGEQWPTGRRDEEGLRLLTGVDPLKDQSYFLCTLNRSQLSRAVFPLGRMYKTQVREIARREGLAEVAEKPESMGICFVGKRKNFEEFMEQYVDCVPGEMVDESGRVVGEHRGVHAYTLGKRVAMKGSHLGMFVSRIDAESNRVHVCAGSHHPSLYATRFVIHEPEWVCDEPFRGKDSCRVEYRIQRTHQPVRCELIRMAGGRYEVRSSVPMRAVADGQMAVFYRGEICLGGGEVSTVIETLATSGRT